MHSLLPSRWLASIAIVLSFNPLVSCQLGNVLGGVGSALDTLLVPAAAAPTTQAPQQNTPIVEDTPTAAAPVATTIAATTTQQAAANVIVTNLVQTTVIQSKPTVITSQVSLPIIPTLSLDGSTTWSVGTNVYTLEVKNGKTSIVGPTATDGRSVRLSQSVVSGMPVIVSYMDITQILTSVITQATSQTSAPSSTGHPSSSSLGAGAGIGIGVGLSVLLLAVIGVVVFVMKRRKAQPNDDSSVKELMGAAADAEDGTSSTSPTFEKQELDGNEIAFVQHEIIELMGDIPPPQEIDGRELYAPDPPKAALMRADTHGSRSDGALVSPLDGSFPRTPVGSGIRRMDTVSTMHTTYMPSPLDRNNSIRDEKWPPVPPPYRDRDEDR